MGLVECCLGWRLPLRRKQLVDQNVGTDAVTGCGEWDKLLWDSLCLNWLSRPMELLAPYRDGPRLLAPVACMDLHVGHSSDLDSLQGSLAILPRDRHLERCDTLAGAEAFHTRVERAGCRDTMVRLVHPARGTGKRTESEAIRPLSCRRSCCSEASSWDYKGKNESARFPLPV